MATVVKKIKLQIPGGAATPAPPVGTALGTAGVNIGQFVTQFNEATKDKRGSIIPIELSVYDDRSFTFVMKSPPASRLILKAIGIEKGSGKAKETKVGTISKAQIAEIVKEKMTIPGVGYLIFCSDPGGQMFGIHQNDPDAK